MISETESQVHVRRPATLRNFIFPARSRPDPKFERATSRTFDLALYVDFKSPNLVAPYRPLVHLYPYPLPPPDLRYNVIQPASPRAPKLPHTSFHTARTP